MKKIISVLFLVIFLIGNAYAETPLNWPWRGVTLTSLDALPDDIALLKNRLGIKSVRITLDVRQFAQRNGLTPDTAFTKNIEWADSMLDACRDSNVTAVISINQFPIDYTKGLTQVSPEFWNDPAELADVIRVSGIVAGHFKDRGAELGAYEFLSEPAIKDGVSMKLPDQWPSLMEKIVNEIRLNDAGRWIVLTPGVGGMASGYKGFLPLEDKRIIYGAHMYIPFAFTHQGIRDFKLGFTYPGRVYLKFWNKRALEDSFSDLIAFQKKYDVTIWIGEFSAVRWAPGSDKYLLDLAKIFNSYGWGWAYFNIHDYHGWDPDYDTGYSTDKKEEWQSHYVGENTLRWDTLKKMFKLP